jgi:hypothetical protein
MTHKRTISRRAFVRSAATTVAAFYIVPRHVLGGPGHTPPSEVITRAVIGTGGQGLAHVVENVEGKPPVTLAVCDVDRQHLEAGLKKAGRSCEGYADFRRVLDRQDIDTVHIATPPHWHALIAVAAAQAGKDVLGEKPTTRTIGEGRALVEAIRRYGRVYQVNTHSRFENDYQFGATKRLRKLVDSGLLGTPLTVRVTSALDFHWKSNGPDAAARPGRARLRAVARPGPAEAVPSAPRPPELPRILGLRRRRARGHGPALPRSRAVLPE